MATWPRAALGSLCATCLAVALVFTGSDTAAQQGSAKTSAKRVVVPVYAPPRRGAPAGRTAAATRSGGGPPRKLELLAPRHVALTTGAQPSLYWYLSRAVEGRAKLVLTEAGELDPLLEVALVTPMKAGIHAVSLADHHIRLAPGKAYNWEILVRAWAGTPAPVATIERVEAPAGLDPLRADASEFAAAGIWYDAVASLSARIALDPRDRALRAARAALLEQVGLEAPAKADRHGQ